MSTVSPNMTLIIPSVGATPGPEYAIDINNALTLIDAHDHSPGFGVQITPAGMNINTDLSMQGNSLLDVSNVIMSTSATPSVLPLGLSIAPGGESPQQQDLWYTPDTGVPIQITKNGQVNVIASSIDGETYAAGTFFWTQAQDALPTTPANFDIGSITIRPNVAATSFGVQLNPPSAISSLYSINLPLLPTSQKIMTLDASGNMSAPYTVDNSTIEIASNVIRVKDQGITNAKILDGTIGVEKFQPGTVNTFSQSLTVYTPSFTVRVATTANGTMGTAFDNGSTIDGVVLATGNLILIKNQTTSSDNGVYVVQASGTPVRDTSYDTFTELNYAGVNVTLGTTNASTKWFQNNVLTAITDSQSWSKSSTVEFIVPANVYSLSILGTGGGGGGGSGATKAAPPGANGVQGGGGGSGVEPKLVTVPVTPGLSLAVTVGAGGPGGAGTSIGAGSLSGNDGADGSYTTIIGTGVNIIFNKGLGGAGGIVSNSNPSAIPAAWNILGNNSAAGRGGSGGGSAGTAGGSNTYINESAAGGNGDPGAGTVPAGGGGGGGAGWEAGGDGSNAVNGGISSPGGAGGLGAGGGGSGGGVSNGPTGAGKGGKGGGGKVLISYFIGQAP